MADRAAGPDRGFEERPVTWRYVWQAARNAAEKRSAADQQFGDFINWHNSEQVGILLEAGANLAAGDLRRLHPSESQARSPLETRRLRLFFPRRLPRPKPVDPPADIGPQGIDFLDCPDPRTPLERYELTVLTLRLETLSQLVAAEDWTEQGFSAAFAAVLSSGSSSQNTAKHDIAVTLSVQGRLLVAGRDAKWQGVREFFRQRLGVLLPRGIELKLRAIEGLPDTVSELQRSVQSSTPGAPERPRDVTRAQPEQLLAERYVRSGAYTPGDGRPRWNASPRLPLSGVVPKTPRVPPFNAIPIEPTIKPGTIGLPARDAEIGRAPRGAHDLSAVQQRDASQRRSASRLDLSLAEPPSLGGSVSRSTSVDRARPLSARGSSEASRLLDRSASVSRLSDRPGRADFKPPARSLSNMRSRSTSARSLDVFDLKAEIARLDAAATPRPELQVDQPPPPPLRGGPHGLKRTVPRVSLAGTLHANFEQEKAMMRLSAQLAREPPPEAKKRAAPPADAMTSSVLDRSAVDSLEPVDENNAFDTPVLVRAPQRAPVSPRGAASGWGPRVPQVRVGVPAPGPPLVVEVPRGQPRMPPRIGGEDGDAPSPPRGTTEALGAPSQRPLSPPATRADPVSPPVSPFAVRSVVPVPRGQPRRAPGILQGEGEETV